MNVVPPEAEAIVKGMSLPNIELAMKVTLETGVQFELSDQVGGEVHIKAIGVGGHASTPELAINALTGI
ncbi:hypothetical protein QCD71_25140, partial [Sphingomonas sp. PsM26]|nr:hypothetical protein [Sphingomonas sp. PsM26]